jgi:hypothetical protein
MRNISFMLTTNQFLQRTKHVTRRLGWKNCKTGDVLMGCEKCQGLKPGQKLVRLGPIRVVSARREPLVKMINLPVYGQDEARLEGFPLMDGAAFVEMFCAHMSCTPATEVTRIQFEYLDNP